MIRKLAISTGGGDAPGINAVIRSVTLAACVRGWEVWGISHGYRGLLEPERDGGCGVIRLDNVAVRGIIARGGTILGTANRGDPFRYPTREDDALVARDRSAELVARF